ncbi:MAG: hypothetical protein EBY30_14610, partial [Rhodospirillales bacterium]|nr:hypothetical protein [Rhodospirillales bacterium]
RRIRRPALQFENAILLERESMELFAEHKMTGKQFRKTHAERENGVAPDEPWIKPVENLKYQAFRATLQLV